MAKNSPWAPCSRLEFFYDGDGGGDVSVLNAEDNGIVVNASTCKLMCK